MAFAKILNWKRSIQNKNEFKKREENEMGKRTNKNKRQINVKKMMLFILLVVIIVAAIVFKVNNNPKTAIKGVVVRVYDTSLMVMGIDNAPGLFTVSIKNKENTKFKQGQEILVYTNGTIMETYPAQIGTAKKIKIVKEESDNQIPDNILKYCYSSRDNVEVVVDKLTASGLTLTITDKNEQPYHYYTKYTISQKVKNPNGTGEAQKVGEDTNNATAGSTRYRSRIYMGRS